MTASYKEKVRSKNLCDQAGMPKIGRIAGKGDLLGSLEAHRGPISAVQALPNSQMVLSAGKLDHTVRLISVRSPAFLFLQSLTVVLCMEDASPQECKAWFFGSWSSCIGQAPSSGSQCTSIGRLESGPLMMPPSRMRS